MKERAQKAESKAAVLLPAALIAIVSFTVYSNAISSGFIYDDHSQVLKNYLIRDIRNIPELFLKSVWTFEGAPPTSNYYRPLVNVLYMFNYYLFGLHAWGFHLLNILFHAGNSVLVFLLVSNLRAGNPVIERTVKPAPALSSTFLSAPVISGLLFAVHPIHVEAVTWIAGLADVSFAFFFLLSFYLYLRSQDHYGWKYAFSVLSFLLSVLCKEPALTLPIIMMANDWAYRRASLFSAACVKRYVPYIVVMGLFVAVRYFVLGGLTPLKRFKQLDAFDQALNVFPLFTRYLRMLFFPTNLNFWPVFHPVTSLFSMDAAVSVGVTALYIALMILAFRKNKTLFLGLVVVLVPLMPAFYLKGLIGKPIADRYLYLPSAGYGMLLAVLFSWVRDRMPGITNRVILVFALLLGVYSVATLERNTVWRDEYSLFADTVGKSPNSTVPHLEFGNALLARGQFDEAIEQFRIVVQMEPLLFMVYYHLGLAFAAEDRLYEAVEQYQIALRLEPNLPEIHEDLGRAYARAGFNDAAINEFKISVALGPSASRFNLLGVAYARKSQMDRAVENFNMAASLDPSCAAYRRNLDAALDMKNSPGLKKDSQGNTPFDYEPRYLTNTELFSFAW